MATDEATQTDTATDNDTVGAAATAVADQKKVPTGQLWVWMKDGEGKSYGGHPVSRGQILSLRGLPNDYKLISAGYVEKVGKGVEKAQCFNCGEWFIADDYKYIHEQSHGEQAEINLGDTGV